MKLLIKFGSALLTKNNRINFEFLEKKIEEIAHLHSLGHKIIIVSSGAVAAGMQIRGLTHRPKETIRLQMLSGIGQTKLIKSYKDLLKDKGLFCAQVLLTHHNFSTVGEESSFLSVLDLYLEEGIIPIINENDLVDKEELEDTIAFSDNDILAALVASKLKVDTALILTDVDGLFDVNPKDNKNAKFYDKIRLITKEIFAMADNGKSDLGLGGMLSKIKAAEIITTNGIPTIIGNGHYSLIKLLENKVRRTYFNPSNCD